MKTLLTYLLFFHLLTPTGWAGCELLAELRDSGANRDPVRFKLMLLDSIFNHPTDQDQFILKAQSSVPNGLFIHYENAALNLLAQKYFNDREMAQALTKYAKLSFLEQLGHLHPLVYSDYKSLRLWLPEDSQPLRKQVRTAVQQTAQANHQIVGSLGLYQNALQPFPFGAPKGWFLAGSAQVADIAALGSRYARKVVTAGEMGKNQHVGLMDADRAPMIRLFESRIKDIELRRRWLLKNIPSAFEPFFNGNLESNVLKGPILTLLRSMPNNFDSSHLKHLIDWAMGLSSVELTPEQARQLIEYYQLVDSFVPPLHINEDTALSYVHGHDDALVVDHTGQNNENLRAAMSALAQASSSADLSTRAIVPKSIREARLAQNAASKRFVDNIERTKKEFWELGLRFTQLRGSGDDLIFFLEPGTTSEEIGRAVNQFYKMGNGDRVRMVLIHTPTHLSESVDAMGRSEWIARAEEMEKLLRLRLAKQFGVQNSPLKNTLIALHVTVDEPREAAFDVHVAGLKDPSKISLIRETVNQILIREDKFEGFRFDSVFSDWPQP